MEQQQPHPQRQFSPAHVQNPGPVVVHQVYAPQPAEPAQDTEAAANPGGRPRFARDSQFRCGVLQIVLGGIAFALGVVAILIGAGRGYGGYRYVSSYGSGVWCGASFIATGILGVISAKNARTYTLIGCLVMSLVSTLFGGTLLGMAIAMVANDEGNRFDWDYRNGESISTPVKNVEKRLVVDSFIVVVAVAEMVVAIIQSVICCRTLCRCNCKWTKTVVYIPLQMVPQNSFSPTGVVQPANIPTGNILVAQVPLGTNIAQPGYLMTGAAPGITPVNTSTGATDHPPEYDHTEKQQPPP